MVIEAMRLAAKLIPEIAVLDLFAVAQWPRGEPGNPRASAYTLKNLAGLDLIRALGISFKMALRPA